MKKMIQIFSFVGVSTLLFGSHLLLNNNKTIAPAEAASSPDLVITTDQQMQEFIDTVNLGEASGTSHSGHDYYGQLIELGADVSITLTKAPTNNATAKLYSFFSGTFDGKGHTINLTYNCESKSCALFRNLQGTVKNVVFNANMNCGDFAALVCTNSNGKIDNCSTTAESTFNCGENIGAFCYNLQASSVTSNCVNNADITSSVGAAGIAYKVGTNASIINCVNNGDIEATTNHAAGITCYVINNSYVKNCVNYGNISSSEGYTAGIANEVYGEGAYLADCVNYGTLTSTKFNDGGIASLISDKEGIGGRIYRCINNGDITLTISSDSYNVHEGGIVGFSYQNGLIDRCTNNGHLKTTSGYGTGGILGGSKYGVTYISNCANTGLLENGRNGSPYVGGMVGIAEVATGADGKPDISNCLSAGELKTTRKSKNQYIGYVGTGNTPSNITSTNNISIANDHGYENSGVACTVKATSSSANVLSLIKNVRAFKCESDTALISDLRNAYNGLTDEEITLLKSITYYDYNEETADRDYISAAEYILGFSPTVSSLPISGNNDIKLTTTLTVVVVGVSLLTCSVLLLNKKKHLTK